MKDEYKDNFIEHQCEQCRAICEKAQAPESRFCFLDFESFYSVIILNTDEDENTLYTEFEENYREWKRWLRTQEI